MNLDNHFIADSFSLYTRGYTALVFFAAPSLFIFGVFGIQPSELIQFITVLIVFTSFFWQIIRKQANEDSIHNLKRNNQTVLGLFRTISKDQVIRYDSFTINRYHATLERIIPDWKKPTDYEEINQFDQSYDMYQSATKWLRENTRNRERFPVVYAELVNYTKQKSLYSMKKLGCAIHLLLVFIWCINFLVRLYYPSIAMLNISNILIQINGINVVGLLFGLLFWFLCVNDSMVDSASKAYSRALHSAIDLF